MKTRLISRFLTAIFALVSIQVASAAVSPTGNPDIYSQLENQLKWIGEEVKGDMTIEISFMIDEDNKIVVLETDDKSLEAEVKNALNYMKIYEPQGLKPYKKYVLPVSFKKI